MKTLSAFFRSLLPSQQLFASMVRGASTLEMTLVAIGCIAIGAGGYEVFQRNRVKSNLEEALEAKARQPRVVNVFEQVRAVKSDTITNGEDALRARGLFSSSASPQFYLHDSPVASGQPPILSYVLTLFPFEEAFEATVATDPAEPGVETADYKGTPVLVKRGRRLFNDCSVDLSTATSPLDILARAYLEDSTLFLAKAETSFLVPGRIQAESNAFFQFEPPLSDPAPPDCSLLPGTDPNKVACGAVTGGTVKPAGAVDTRIGCCVCDNGNGWPYCRRPNPGDDDDDSWPPPTDTPTPPPVDFCAQQAASDPSVQTACANAGGVYGDPADPDCGCCKCPPPDQNFPLIQTGEVCGSKAETGKVNCRVVRLRDLCPPTGCGRRCWVCDDGKGNTFDDDDDTATPDPTPFSTPCIEYPCTGATVWSSAQCKCVPATAVATCVPSVSDPMEFTCDSGGSDPMLISDATGALMVGPDGAGGFVFRCTGGTVFFDSRCQ